MLDNNPGREVEKVRLPKRKRYVDDDEFQTVYSLASPTLQVTMDLAVLTGLRRGDLLSLTRDNLTDEGILITPGKTQNTSGKTLLIEWSEELRQVIDRAKRLPPEVHQCRTSIFGPANETTGVNANTIKAINILFIFSSFFIVV